jgi:hypothetical protein
MSWRVVKETGFAARTATSHAPNPGARPPKMQRAPVSSRHGWLNIGWIELHGRARLLHVAP